MTEISPSNEECMQRVDELETRLRRIAALSVALSEIGCHLPPGSREVDAVQSLSSLLEDESAAAVSDILWMLHAANLRIPQIESLLKSAA